MPMESSIAEAPAGSNPAPYIYVGEQFAGEFARSAAPGVQVADAAVLLYADFTCPEPGELAPLYVRPLPAEAMRPVFEAGDRVMIPAPGRAVCCGTVGDPMPSGAVFQYWLFTRDPDPQRAGTMTAGEIVPEGSVVLAYRAATLPPISETRSGELK